MTGLVIVGLAAAASARLPSTAPPLPPPDPATFTVIAVDTAQALADACWNLASHQAIVIAAGTYDLSAVDFPNGQDGRLTVGRFDAAPIHDVQIRGATGNPEEVVLLGAGMLDPLVPFGFQIFTATDVLIADLSLGQVYYHAVQLDGAQGAERVRLYHLRLFDAGQQIIKASGGADDVIIEYSELFLTAGAVAHPEGSPPGSCYTNAIDGVGVSGWSIRDNLIHDIRCQNLTLAGPAVLLWQGSSGTLVERNTIVDSSRGISLGLVGDPDDHTGGIVRNNFLRWDPSAGYAIDAPIYTTSPGARILHNTALTRGRHPNAVEVRFPFAAGIEARANLLDGAVTLRDGATATVTENLTSAVPSWFDDEATGDLHLAASAGPALDQVTRRAAAADDFDGQPRPTGLGQADLGASERGDQIFGDGFETGDPAAWTAAVP